MTWSAVTLSSWKSCQRNVIVDDRAAIDGQKNSIRCARIFYNAEWGRWNGLREKRFKSRRLQNVEQSMCVRYIFNKQYFSAPRKSFQNHLFRLRRDCVRSQDKFNWRGCTVPTFCSWRSRSSKIWYYFSLSVIYFPFLSLIRPSPVHPIYHLTPASQLLRKISYRLLMVATTRKLVMSVDDNDGTELMLRFFHRHK